MVKAVIFDCFGVVRTNPLDATYRAFGGDPDEDRQFILDTCYASDIGKLPNGAGDVLAKHLGVTLEDWTKKSQSIGGKDDQLIKYIQELRKKYKVGMLSNVGKGGLGRFFDEGFLESKFDDVVESSHIGFAKPEARAYEIAADRLGVRLDECVFTDDREDYTEGAQHVGMKTILYKNFEDFKKELEKKL